MSTVADKAVLKDVRQVKNWTQQEAAEQTGISRSYYVMVENGKRVPSIQVAQKIERVFGINWHTWFEQISIKT